MSVTYFDKVVSRQGAAAQRGRAMGCRGIQAPNADRTHGSPDRAACRAGIPLRSQSRGVTIADRGPSREIAMRVQGTLVSCT